MKKLIVVSLTLLSVLASAREITNKPDFVQKNKDGEVIRRGVYTIDDSGYVIRYDLFDGRGDLVQTQIPYYARNGSLIEAREYDGDGALVRVAVFINNKVFVLDLDGNRVEDMEEQHVDVEGFLKHFQGKQ